MLMLDKVKKMVSTIHTLGILLIYLQLFQIFEITSLKYQIIQETFLALLSKSCHYESSSFSFP